MSREVRGRGERGGGGKRLLIIFIASVSLCTALGLTFPTVPFIALGSGGNVGEVVWLSSVYALGSFLLGPLWGRISDRIGEHYVLVTCAVVTSLSYIWLGLAEELWEIYMSRAMGGIFAGWLVASLSYVSKLPEKDKESGEAKESGESSAKGFAIIGASFGIGLTAGPGVASIILHLSDNYSYPLLLASGLCIASALIIALGLPSHNGNKKITKSRTSLLKLCIDNRHLLLLNLAISICFTAIEATFAVWSASQLGLSGVEVGVLLLVAGLSYALCQLCLVSKLIIRYSAYNIMLVGIILLVSGEVALWLASSYAYAMLGLVICSLAMSMFTPSLQVLLAKGSEEGSRGRIFGINQSFVSLSRILGPLWGGWVLLELGLNWHYLIGGLGVFIILVIFTTMGYLGKLRSVIACLGVLVVLGSCVQAPGGSGNISIAPQEDLILGTAQASSALREYATGQIRLKYAHDNDIKGDGATVGIIDSGVDYRHIVLKDKVWRIEKSMESEREEAPDLDSINTQTQLHGYSHGTALASIIVGDTDIRESNCLPFIGCTSNPNNFVGGVAPLAKIVTVKTPLSLAHPLAVDSSSSSVEKRGEFFTEEMSQLLHHDDVKAVNMSFDISNQLTMSDSCIERESCTGKKGKSGEEIVRDLWRVKGVSNEKSNKILSRLGSGEVIAVIAAGNQPGDDPYILAGTPKYVEESETGILVVVASDRNGQLSQVSSRCGASAGWCLAAPGEDIWAAIATDDPNYTANERPDYNLVSGSSIATAYVTGAIALLAGNDPFLKASEIREILLKTAYKDKDNGYTEENLGQGLLNIEDAVKPQGGLFMSMGTDVRYENINISNSVYDISLPFGDSMRRAGKGTEVALVDRYLRSYPTDLESFFNLDKGYEESGYYTDFLASIMNEKYLGKVKFQSGLFSELEENNGEIYFHYIRPKVSNHNKYAVYVFSELGDDVGFLDSYTETISYGERGIYRQPLGEGSSLSGSFYRALSTGSKNLSDSSYFYFDTWGGSAIYENNIEAVGKINIGSGFLYERGGLLGSRGDKGLEGGENVTLYVNGQWTQQYKNNGILLKGQLGKSFQVEGSSNASIIESSEGVVSSSFGVVGYRKIGEGRSINISIYQPLRIEGGSMFLDIPINRDITSYSVERERVKLDVEPSGRELQFLVGINERLNSSAWLYLYMTHRQDISHVDGENDTGFMLLLSLLV